MAVPAATPVTTPDEFTVAIEVLLETYGFEALEVPVPVKVVVDPTQTVWIPEIVGVGFMVTVNVVAVIVQLFKVLVPVRLKVNVTDTALELVINGKSTVVFVAEVGLIVTPLDNDPCNAQVKIFEPPLVLFTTGVTAAGSPELQIDGIVTALKVKFGLTVTSILNGVPEHPLA